ncbi:MAG: SPASM domain-containing protein [Sedimentisphaerales bacterium]|nr:SPASM domain-containing protein [Sedimentisphaerales bacterium]
MKELRHLKLADYLSESKDRQERFARYRSLWRQTESCDLLTDYPLQLDIELSGLCNLRCEHCFQNGLITGKLGFMDVALFRKIIDEGAVNGLCAIKLQVRGESFLHPNWFECCRYAKAAGIMDIQITTNATLLDYDLGLQILDSGLDGIIFSVDDHHQETWQNSGKPGDYYTQTERNIQQFLELRRKMGSSRPWVRIQSAIAELDDDSYKKTREYIISKFPDADAVLVNRIHNFDNECDSYPDLHSSYRFLPCVYLFQRLAVFWDGSVTVCCVDYNNEFALGNANVQSIREIWLGGKIQSMRDCHLNDGRADMHICKHCHLSTQGAHWNINQIAHPLSPSVDVVKT